jgi:hypothetical protein
MRKVSIRQAVAGLVLLMSVQAAGAHGIAGNRFFVGTLTFDDPSVADEAIVPHFSTLNQPVEGGNATANRFDWAFTRLLTPVLQVQADSGWIHRNWPTARTSGFATTDVGIKSEIYRDNQHEMLVSTGILWGIGQEARNYDSATGGTSRPGSVLAVYGRYSGSSGAPRKSDCAYDPAEHRSLATRFGGQDAKVHALSYLSWALWLLGYPEAALAASHRALSDAREIGQASVRRKGEPFSPVRRVPSPLSPCRHDPADRGHKDGTISASRRSAVC